MSGTASATAVIKALKSLGTPEKAKIAAFFFKTGEGQYGHGDHFLGVKVPEQRRLARQFKDLSLSEIKKLLHHTTHECRLTALIILAGQYARAAEARREAIAAFYLLHTRRINNWDLVDASARDILGEHLLTRDRAVLYELARSSDLWERRIAIVATHAFIRHRQYADTLKIAELLLADRHDLIHKAVGWMLREVGNRSLAAEERFLKQHAAKMPRTMLRYAVEKMEQGKRQKFLRAKT
jgi:3-methyladenine DNA glycosylase AlkD